MGALQWRKRAFGDCEPRGTIQGARVGRGTNGCVVAVFAPHGVAGAVVERVVSQSRSSHCVWCHGRLSKDVSWGVFRPEVNAPDEPENDKSIDKEGAT